MRIPDFVQCWLLLLLLNFLKCPAWSQMISEGSGDSEHMGIAHPNFAVLPPNEENVRPPPQQDEDEKCISGPSWWYRGTRSHTMTQIECQRWDTNHPHVVRYHPDGNDTNHNHCRNPDRDIKGTWCYTTDPTMRWSYCGIRKCEDDSLVIWTNYFPNTENSEIVSMLAEQELHLQKQHDGEEAFKSIAYSRKPDTEYWSVVGDYQDDRIFFTDYKSEMIGVVNLLTNITTSYFHGMAHGIEGLAYDWERKNLYWTDSALMWIMVTDQHFQYYATVYRSENPLYGLALHVKYRKLFFSTYKMVESKISSTDLAGKNETVLLEFPKVYDVTGLTLDYTDDRLYWTDYNGSGGLVVSCNLDGNDLIEHFSRVTSQFWGIASYLDFLFVTDVHPRMTAEMNELYFIWVIRKQASYNDKAVQHSLQGKPRGISVYSKNEERSFVKEEFHGSCVVMPECDHICLPRTNATRECVCSMGYHKLASDETKCRAALLPDDYLLICDAGQGLVFQLPLNQSNPDFYSIVPLIDNIKVLTAKVDAQHGDIYWASDQNYFFPALHKSSQDGQKFEILSPNNTVKVIAKDSMTGNIYFVDEGTRDIKVMSYPGLFTKTIIKMMDPQPLRHIAPIKKLAVDVRHKFLYWTTGGIDKEGKVWRSDLDGRNMKSTISDMNWPTALTIDQKRKSLFVAEGKVPTIYEIPLESMAQMQVKSKYKTYDVSHYHDIAPQIIDMKVHNDVLYYVDTQHNQIQTINLIHEKEVPASSGTAGPADFFNINSIEVYSSRYYLEHIASIGNPCQTVEPFCEQICAAVSATERRCICEDGFDLVNEHQCVEGTGTDDSNTPPKTMNCPSDIRLKALPCQDLVGVDWQVPTWTDDQTEHGNLKITLPMESPPARLTVGTHIMEYYAQDEQSAVSSCQFEINIERSDCGEPAHLPDYFEATKLSCLNDKLSYVVSCVDGGEISAYTTGLLGPILTNFCLAPVGMWAIRDFSIYQCIVSMHAHQQETTTATAPPDGRHLFNDATTSMDGGSIPDTTKPSVHTTRAEVAEEVPEKTITSFVGITVATTAGGNKIEDIAEDIIKIDVPEATTAGRNKIEEIAEDIIKIDVPEATTAGRNKIEEIAEDIIRIDVPEATTGRHNKIEEIAEDIIKIDVPEATTNADDRHKAHVDWHTSNITKMIIGVCSVGGFVILVMLFLMLKRRRGCRSWSSLPLDVKVLWRRREGDRGAEEPVDGVDSSTVYAKMS